MQPGFAGMPMQNILLVFVVYSDLTLTLAKENTGYGFPYGDQLHFLFFHLFDFKLRPWPSAIF